MLNTDNFIKRIETILEYYNLNASSFADKITIQRSSMSHLLSGRNKPSLDFVLKVVEFFPEVDLDWILIGKGVFPKKTQIDEKNSLNLTPIAESVSNPLDLFSQINDSIDIPTPTKKTNQNSDLFKMEEMNEAEKIIIFYKNGTFKMYSPS